MATILPFRGLRFNEEKAGGPLSDLGCPPYDVIDPAMQEALYQKNPYNVVRVEYGKQAPIDTLGNDRYSRAAQTFQEWIANDILTQEKRQAFYIYSQTYDTSAGGAAQNKTLVRRGFFGRVKLEPFGTGSIYPHEETFGGPKADRLQLMRTCKANLSPVFGL